MLITFISFFWFLLQSTVTMIEGILLIAIIMVATISGLTIAWLEVSHAN